MTKVDVVDRLKTNRSKLRRNVVKGVQSEIERCAKGGHFPDFALISKGIMDTIACEMKENQDTPIIEWIVMLQGKEPDRFCENTMSIVEELCPEK